MGGMDTSSIVQEQNRKREKLIQKLAVQVEESTKTIKALSERVTAQSLDIAELQSELQNLKNLEKADKKKSSPKNSNDGGK